ncbi:SWI/SNF-related matrix-associated actin-dependent regulator of chromatin subfamily A member 5-like [Wyeomyia smithii]|uniref:SWI/SNF-related matrix-associated actin-dependent regulator of chromatin subfamily A member 5-like n=1 Tax=Wyeomyia smithii TaxID=174621 RepID=UPI002467D9A8|nr:SWI/SNF-related matrix-associated actin-dependent regulator of chromatin subfamily A member 5-like [Wyeomyia smithii]
MIIPFVTDISQRVSKILLPLQFLSNNMSNQVANNGDDAAAGNSENSDIKHPERRHSATPSDVMDMDHSVDDSTNLSAYRRDLSDAQMCRLEFLEDQFLQFKQFIEQRKGTKNPASKGNTKDSNNNQPVKRERKRVQQHIGKEKDLLKVGAYFTTSPSFINGVMRDYQVDGLNWLISLYDKGINGILADEMGLGKTLQSISMLGYLRHHKNIKGPHLVIVPLSTINNWIREFQRFIPDVRVLRGHCYKQDKGQLYKTLAAGRRSWDVVVTNYQFFVSEKTHFKRINYQYVILDEAQRCKNEHTQFSSLLRQITYRSILFLTGTPINNNLHELWAMLNLLLPEFFRDAEDFDSWFKVEDCIDPNHERSLRLKNILQPIMLRRIKAEVELNIPPKIKTTIFMPPTRAMRYWSKKVINRDIQLTRGAGYSVNFHMANIFPYLRQVTLHPYLMPGAEPEPFEEGQHLVDASSRMIVLDKLLARLYKRGSRVLIFSQFVVLLNILDDYLAWKGYKYSRLTGDTNTDERQVLLDDFNAPGSDKFIFMLTTRAGGVGINLPTADTVIFYDVDWNPQADFQAEDRAHRIGQTKQVHVFRFIVLGTVDESLYRCSYLKQALDKAIVKKSLGEAEISSAIKHHEEYLQVGSSIDVAAVDSQLDSIFEEIDRGARNPEQDTLFKEVYLKGTLKRRLSEERELDAIKPPPEPILPTIDLSGPAGYVYKPRKAKKARCYINENYSDEF